jgi:hypothetical protein
LTEGGRFFVWLSTFKDTDRNFQPGLHAEKVAFLPFWAKDIKIPGLQTRPNQAFSGIKNRTERHT